MKYLFIVCIVFLPVCFVVAQNNMAEKHNNNITTDTPYIADSLATPQALRPDLKNVNDVKVDVGINLSLPNKIGEDAKSIAIPTTNWNAKENNRYLFDLDELAMSPIYNRFYQYRQIERRTYIGLGEYLRFNEGLQWMPNDKWAIEAGIIYTRQYNQFTADRIDCWGLNAAITYNITNNLGIGITAMQMVPTTTMNGALLFPLSSVGPSLMFNTKNQTQVGIGVSQKNYDNKFYKSGKECKVSVTF
jgi:hypothetical protein